METPFIMVIFGATGDLALNKLIPSLFSLFKQKKLPKDFWIIGFSRRTLKDEEFRDFFTNLSKESGWSEFSKHLSYQEGDFGKEEGYKSLIDKLNKLDKKLGACITRFFYLATPPDNYNKILDFLDSTKLSEGCGQESRKWTRIIIEKPFGKDLKSAKDLDIKLVKIFEEKQIFRVDHYLSKETVRNMIAFRFANGIFEPVWNKNYIDHIQITFAEKKGIGTRGRFFDGVGILRDVAQNHLLQLLTAVAMEQPISFEKEAIRDARAKVIKSIRQIDPKDVSKYVARGQYEGYRKEKDVEKNSNTETFTALKLFVDTDRFSGVPFYLRAGKQMPKDKVSISIVFIQTCHILFKEYGCPEIGNVLTINIQPDEGISLRVIAKKPADRLALDTVNMKFSYQEEFGGKGVDAYEKVLMDIFSGDQMLFNRSDELQSSWELITKILKGWEEERKPSWKIPTYKKESWGPEEGRKLIENDLKQWIE
jgi:glucose-6-phosphate 1-dehydrogenase